MRPVRLTLGGFASFRDQQTIDFSDADYFALVGPTGSGKSTVLDALSFALYGTAPRWGGSSVVRYALAPTSNQAVVSLIFDVDGRRYQVAREVRRVGASISQRNVSLVRFADPSVVDPDPDDPPETIAGSIAELNRAVVDLLGLGFEDFCQCVVLPQGQFATFLTASAATRQEILLKLLGAARYEEKIGRRAHELARDAGQRVVLLGEQAARFADVTQAGIDDLAADVETLERTRRQATETVAAIEDALRQAEGHRQRSAGLRDALNRLGAVEQPAGIAGLQQRATRVRDDIRCAATARLDAERLAEETRAALEAAPSSAALTAVQGQYARRRDLRERRDPARAAVDGALEQEAAAQAELTAAEASLLAARDHAAEQSRLTQGAAQTAQRADARLAGLTAIAPPADLDSLASRHAAALDSHREAEMVQQQAVSDQDQAQTALRAAPSPERIELAGRRLAELQDLAARSETVTTRAGQAAAATAAAQQGVADADAALAQARQRQDTARVLAGAAALRPALQPGHECPVCEQTVTVLPDPLASPELDGCAAAVAAAQQRLDLSRAALAGAQRDEHAATRDADRHADTLQAAGAALQELLGSSDPAAARELLSDWESQRSTAEAGFEDATHAVAEATGQLREAEAGVVRVQREIGSVGHSLHAALGRLSQLPDTTVPATVHEAATEALAGWIALLHWLPSERAAAHAQAGQASAAAALAAVAATEATQRLEIAEQRERAASRAHRAAHATSVEKAGLFSQLERDLVDLTTMLVTAHAEAEIPGLLRQAATLAEAADQARHRLAAARAADQQAQTAAADLDGEITSARQDLGRTRDALGGLSPPAVDDRDLGAAWRTLVEWAGTEQTRLGLEAEEADRAGASAAATAAEQARQLSVLLGRAGVDVDPATAPGAILTEVVTALAGARHRLDAARSDLAESQRLQAQIAAATDEAQVARELTHHMHAKKFPQWLAGSALDALVGGASASLRQLSGEQFDLTHRNGEFYVIDHADADSERSVRTLSGGETFQASLALALSLADHLAGMLGGASLDSIFLDEGFGTLDPDSLETVAATLENLAGGNRTVGVITHVSALADRAPVRFRVRRDARTSTITREGG